MTSLKKPQIPLLSSFPSPCSSYPYLSSLPSLTFPRLKKPPHPPVAEASFKKSRFLFPTCGPNARREVALRSSVRDGGGDAVEEERPPFDLDLAVVLAGFAFEAYSSPPEDAGWREVDTADCQTVFLSGQFIREIYDGQLRIKLKKGVDLPAMDPWGTSDPYVVLQVEGQVAKSKVKWASKEPTWNEHLTLNIRKTRAKILQVAAWDANLVTPHKCMGSAKVNIESLCNGDLHEVMVELEGIGGIGDGGKIYLEVIYKSYDEIEIEKQWWRIPFLSDFLMKTNYASALKLVLGSESISVSQFVESTFGQLKTLTYYLEKPKPSSSNSDNPGSEYPDFSISRVAGPASFLQQESSSESSNRSGDKLNLEKEFSSLTVQTNAEESSALERKYDKSEPPDEYFWRTFADKIGQVVHQKLGFSLPEIKMWEGFDILNKVSLHSQRNAEKDYVEFGLATPEDMSNDERTDQSSMDPEYSLLDIMKLSRDVLSQTETIFGALLVLTTILSQRKNNLMSLLDKSSNEDMAKIQDENVEYSANDVENLAIQGFPLATQKTEEMRELFSRAESAMEAWSMLATSLGRESFIKSDFEKICFLDNTATDTQVAIWRDSLRRRLVVAFRGTEQSKWKDLATDLMLLPVGLTPERLSGDYKQEVQVHSGFLNAYDSVKNRIMVLIEHSMVFELKDDLERLKDDPESVSKWKVYITGHSLGGALATLLALELSLSQMAKHGKISVTMYNFGSPRVGNRGFAELYNEKVKDSWRIVNHRDIIPTVPRLMGYCHVARPVYLAASDLKGLVNREFLGDGYQDDIIGESTPDVLLNEIMKGERQLIEQILQTEINLLRAIRDGTALMQHMEDFYYITLLESVKSNHGHQQRRTDNSNPSSLES